MSHVIHPFHSASNATAALRSPQPGRSGLRSATSASLGSTPDSGVQVEILDPNVDSDLDEDVVSQGTTYSASDIFSDFQFVGETRCCVILSQKDSLKRALICADHAGACSRKSHKTLDEDPKRVGPIGFYLIVPNSKGGSDAVLETLRTQEDINRQRHADRKVVEELFSPQGERKPNPEQQVFPLKNRD